MTLAFVVIAFFGVGFEFRRWWTLGLPVVLGTLAAVAIASNSHGLSDTPIPFIVVLGTVATAAGIVMGRNRARSASE